ncbi:hypothetical protein Nepgr_018803 [Nepenthes gracilis]|uniref:Uncharacterized protein n=1 Tax=Nepenthes gracilis TaxID=150966 RepID=A0AAD3XTG9_NEPGR|nr:hypothetical protein Nepgr_018803 [Nepenthes gracilis]
MSDSEPFTVDRATFRATKGEGETKCKAKKLCSAAGKPPRKRAMPKCSPMPSSCTAVLPNEVECPSISLAVKDFAEVLEEAPASVSPPAAAVSSKLDAAGSGSHVGKHPKGVVSMLVFGSPDPGAEPGVPASVGEGHPRGFLLGALLHGSIGSGIRLTKEVNPPFLIRCSGAISPNSAVVRIATFGSLTCSAKGVGSQEDGSAPSFLAASAISKVADKLMELIFPESAVAALEVVSPEDLLDSKLRHLPLHDAQSCSQAGLDALEVVPKSPISNPSISNDFLLEESSTIERPVGDEVLLASEKQGIDWDSDVVSSQSSEGWSAEDIENDPMHYVLQRLLMENATQLYVSSIAKGLQSFDCSNRSQLLNARCVVEEVHNFDRLENVGTWIQAKPRRKRKAAPKHSKSSSASIADL